MPTIEWMALDETLTSVMDGNAKRSGKTARRLDAMSLERETLSVGPRRYPNPLRRTGVQRDE
jgi:hypothetical protein